MKNLINVLLFSFSTLVIHAAQMNITYEQQMKEKLSEEEQSSSRAMFDIITCDLLFQKEPYKKLDAILKQYPRIINAQDKKGATVLMWASNEGYAGLVDLFLDADASVDIQNENGSTALMFASQKGHTKIVERLLDDDASVDIQNNAGMTALMSASKEGYIETVKLLLTADASVDIQNDAGMTALMYASEESHLDIIKLLIAACAENIENNVDDDKVARDYAPYKFKFDEAVEEGLQRGELYEKDRAAAHAFILEAVPVTALLDIITDYAYNPQNPDDLPEKEKSWCVVQ